MRIRVALDNWDSDDSFWIRPGACIPVAKRAVWVVDYGGQPGASVVAGTYQDPGDGVDIGSVRFLLLSEAERDTRLGPAVPYRVGERLMSVDGELVLSPGDAFNFLSSMPKELRNLPVAFDLRLYGGQLDTGSGPGTTDYPAELILKQYSKGGEESAETCLFPGDANARVVLPLSTNYHNDDDSAQWAFFLQGHNPTGAAASKTVKVFGSLVYGTHPRRFEYQGMRSAGTPSSPGSNRFWSAMCTLDWSGYSYLARYQIINNASAGTLRWRPLYYIPTTDGGPAGGLISNIDVAAGGNSQNTLALYSRHLFWDLSYTTAPTGPDYTLHTELP